MLTLGIIETVEIEPIKSLKLDRYFLFVFTPGQHYRSPKFYVGVIVVVHTLVGLPGIVGEKTVSSPGGAFIPSPPPDNIDSSTNEIV